MRQSVLLAALLLGGVVVADPPPRLVGSIPAGDATDLAVDTRVVVVTFDRDTDPAGFAVVRTQEGVLPKLAGEVTWVNPRTARVPLAPMKEGLSYAIGFKPEPITVLRFKTAAPGEPAAPTVVRTAPEFGSVAVDHDRREVVVEFAEDVRPGAWDVKRLRGAADPTKASEHAPYLKTSRILAIPVRLEGGTTYGVHIRGVVAKKTGRTFVPFQLAFATKADERGLVGEWRWTSADGQNEMRLTFMADGSYVHWSRLRGRETTVRGTWRDLGGEVEVRPERRGPARIRYRRLGRAVLDLKLGSAAPLRLRLHEEVEAAPVVEPKPTGRIVFRSGTVLKVMTADGAKSRALWQQAAADPWWSSDYATLACSSGGDLMLGDLGSMKLERITRDARLTRPGVTFDRKYAVCVSGDRMVVVRVANGRTVFAWDPKQHGSPRATHPRLSPDGRSVVFSDGAEHAESLAVCTLVELLQNRPAPVRIVRSDGSLSNTRAAWSPDGRRLVFVRGTRTTGDLFVVNRDGSGLRRLTRTAADRRPMDPCWSPDGRRIVYSLVDPKGRSDLWMTDADGTDTHRLTDGGVSGSPAWGRAPD